MNATRSTPLGSRVRPDVPYSIHHESFESPGANRQYDPMDVVDPDTYLNEFMPEVVTCDYSRRMHYAAFRWRNSRTSASIVEWREAYWRLRDAIVLGHRKLIYRVIKLQGIPPSRSDDMVGEGQIVLLKAVGTFNPWLGIHFSTYAFTCIARAISRANQRMATDFLANSTSFANLQTDEPELPNKNSGTEFIGWLELILKDEHPLLTVREKAILVRRFYDDTDRPNTLESIGREFGITKEGVRLAQVRAIDKLRSAILHD